jgi:CHAD domain-containing protein
VAKAGIKWDERRGAAVNARRILPEFVAAYFREVRDFLAKDRDPAELHRMRLASKRLRYTLELFRPCYGPGLEERLKALKELQDSLGEVNDAVATRVLLGHKVERKARDFLRNRAGEKAAEFRKHWSESFDAPEREAWWTGYLERTAKAPRKKSTGTRSTRS